MEIDQLHKSKYHATHLGIVTDKQLERINKLLNKAARNAIGLTPRLSNRSYTSTNKRNGAGIFTLKDRASQMGIEHITEVLNKPTE